MDEAVTQFWRAADRRIINGILRRSSLARRIFWRSYYTTSLWAVRDPDLRFMNLGLLDEDRGLPAEPTSAVDVQNELGANLYRRVIEAGGAAFHGTGVELGCGLAGGVNVLASQDGIDHMIGLDGTPKILEAARRRGVCPSVELDLVPRGGLNLAPSSVDFAISVEVPHCLPQPDRLLAPVRDALRPDGVFVVADLLFPDMSGMDERALVFHFMACGFNVLDRSDIRDAVVRAREAAGSAIEAEGWVERCVPRPLRREAREALFLPGTINFGHLETGRIGYGLWILGAGERRVTSRAERRVRA